MENKEKTLKKEKGTEKYYKDNPEKAKKRASKRYYENKEEALEKNREYRKNNPDKIKKHNKKYRDNPDNKVKINLRARHYQNGLREHKIREKGSCEICDSKESLELHHMEYKEDSEQVRVLCKKCHNKIHRKIFGKDLI